MAKGYRPVERNQEFLLPPSMADWLPDGHLAWFVIDAVAELDTAVLHSRAARRRDGRARRNSAGRASFDPDMLLTLLIYAYACGERSSRQIERLCATDVAFRLICAGDIPDHSVLARFRKVHAQAFAGLFTQVLALCREVGLARLGTVAIDGTKIAGNASRQANRSAEWLVAEAESMDRAAGGCPTDGHAAGERSEQADRVAVELMLLQADQIDAAQDTAFGEARGDELPAGWDGRGGRRERIRAAQTRIQTAQAAAAAERASAAAERAERDAADLAAAEAALGTEIEVRAAAAHAWERQWEHAVAHPGAPLPRGRAPLAPERSRQVRRAQARVEKARYRVEHPDTAPRRGRRADPERADKPARANLTDPDSTIMPTRNGWVQGYNAQLAVTADQIILATHISTNPADIVSYQHMVEQVQHAVTALDATDELGTLLFDAGYASDDTLAAPGPTQLIALGKTHSVRAAARDNPATGDPPPEATAREAMDHRLRTPEGAALYTRRGATVEPGIGNLKKLLTGFSRRGLAAVTSELDLAATSFNLLKIHRAATT